MSLAPEEKRARSSPSYLLTKYEVSRILGIRANQIAFGAPTLEEDERPIWAAAKELEKGSLRLKVRRPLPGGTYYEIDVSDAKLPSDLTSLLHTFESNPAWSNPSLKH